jgi:predicted Fe-Mo cluster-binding NifX family protein
MMELVVIAVPVEQSEPGTVNLPAIRAVARQGADMVIAGPISDLCREAVTSLGIEVVDGIERMTVREAVELYGAGGREALKRYVPPPAKIAVASHGEGLDATLSPKGEVCTSFVLVEPQSMSFEVIKVAVADSPAQASVNAVRAAARSGATAVITPEIRPACCAALRALAIAIALADPSLTVREAVQAYLQGRLESPSYV